MQETYTRDEAVELMRQAWSLARRESSHRVTETRTQENALMDKFYEGAVQKFPLYRREYRSVELLWPKVVAHATPEGGITVTGISGNTLTLTVKDLELIEELTQNPFKLVKT